MHQWRSNGCQENRSEGAGVKMQEVVWGMIGCGDVTEKKSGPGFQKAEHSRMKAVYSRTYEKTLDYACRHHIPVVYKTVEELLKDDEITAVYIATPPQSHAEYAIRCLQSGKIPYLEKPMAQTYEECLEIQREAEEYHPETLPWRLRKEVSGGGKFVDMAVHALDMLQFLFGEIEQVMGKAKNMGGLYEVEDTVAAVFETEQGIVNEILGIGVCHGDISSAINVNKIIAGLLPL